VISNTTLTTMFHGLLGCSQVSHVSAKSKQTIVAITAPSPQKKGSRTTHTGHASDVFPREFAIDLI